MAADPDVPRWDRPAPGETAKAFAAFAIYRDLGPDRSIRRAKETAGGSSANHRYWETWSSANRWPARAAAYDAWLDEHLVAKRREEHLEMAERHATTARGTLALVGAQLSAIQQTELARLRTLERLNATGADVPPELLRSALPPSTLARLLDVAVKVERISAGMATEIEQSIPAEDLTDEELERILDGDDDDAEDEPAA